MSSWGITPTHTTGTSEMCRLCCDHALLSIHGLPTVTKIARRAYTLDNPTVPMGARKQAHIRLCGVLVKRDSHFRRKCSCRSIPLRHSTHVFWPEAIAARWSCGPHVTPVSNRRRRCRAGVSRPPTPRALRRCAAYVATTFTSYLPLPFSMPRGMNL
jgi:hypothetical protein